ncbi:single-stranded-DNA-specific exonuclease RecJ [Synechocystis sp. LKSZ1]|uniref:single-stranded-DNA-specific exonuclease RecJ n=1 Tax=Synechocystis sp. LKSZ1 TaxID=3144951 RepID=UPI00336BE46D
MPSLPCQRWKIAAPPADAVQAISQATGLAPLLAQVLVNRGITHPAQAAVFRDPEALALPNPLTEFPDLEKSVELLSQAIQEKLPVAICGDYDADGMTSTALLLRALRFLGGQVDYAIPSRMTDGYGINERIVREFAEAGIKLILTVDNGISAYGAIALAVELGLTVIITDHHDLPEILPPAQAILNPKLLPATSLYHGLAGVGVAYILAVTTAQRLGQLTGLTSQLLELYTLGTIADLAPLVGVNRRWLKRGLRLLPQSQILGVQALIKVANIQVGQKSLQPDDIGFQLGPRINAVGRIGNPQWVIELLTTTNPDLAQEQAQRCEETNRQRQTLCETIEQEAIKLIESTPLLWQEDRVLLVVHPHWHHGVIGIVASRLVERYGVPVFIATEEGEGQIRGSARGTEEFHIYEALDRCKDLLGKFGGHRAAGGFSLAAANLEAFQQRLRTFAHEHLQPEQLRPLVKIDAEARFADLTFELRQQIDQLQPWGIGNEFPVFWTPQVRLLEQRRVGKEQKHLQLTLTDGPGQIKLKGIAWRWGEYAPLPACLDLAYKLQVNDYRGEKTLQLEIVGCRLP